jgi:16S rRNA (guanine527-N7)-methyltransferase
VAFPDLTTKKLRVGDIGCGAGFPSLVLAMAYPDWHITAIDSVGKKTAFVESAAVGLELKNLEVIHGRTREMGHKPMYQRKFDLLTARAVGVIPTIYADARRLIADHGRWIFYKTPGQAAEELPELQKLAKVKWEVTPEIELPGDAGSRLFTVGVTK